MTSRYMLDCTAGNVHNVPWDTVTLAGGYVTGSPGVCWTSADWQYVQGRGLIPVTIDQGFTGSPVPGATVRDVEAGAWSPSNAIIHKPWTPPRPTIYASRTDMETVVLGYGWTGDVWLAWPAPQPPSKDHALSTYPWLGKANLVGVQYALDVGGIYDKSIVYDPYWPSAAPQEADVIEIPGIPGKYLNGDYHYDSQTDAVYWIGQGTSGRLYMTKSTDGGKTWADPVLI